MQELITEGKLGEIRYIRSEYGFVAKGDRKVRKFNPQLGGGALLDIGIYNLGFLNMIMGKNPDSFTSDVHMTDVGTDDFSVIHLHYSQENGQGARSGCHNGNRAGYPAESRSYRYKRAVFIWTIFKRRKQ